MIRRHFLALPATFAASGFAHGRERRFDLAVLGGGVGGCSAALAAASRGLSVVLTEETEWVGGQLTSQAVPPDEHPWVETVGSSASYRRLRATVRRLARERYALTDAAVKIPHLNPGLGSVSRLCCEPRLALAALTAMLTPFITSGRIVVLTRSVPIKADVAGDRVKAVTVRTPAGELVLTAPYFVDATELGDLLPLAKCEYVVGAESRAETGELHAAEKADQSNQQAFTWCFAVDHRPGENHVIDKPKDYAFWRDYVPKMSPPWPGKLLSWDVSQYNAPTKVRQVAFDPAGPVAKGTLNLWDYRRVVAASQFRPEAGQRDVSLINWPQNDYWLGPIIDVAPEVKAKHLAAGVQLSLSLLYWMQTDAPRPDGGTGWPGLKLRDDLLGPTTGVAMAPYIREARRIVAEFTVTERHIGTEQRCRITGQKVGAVTAEQFTDSVGVGSYRIDLHPSSGGDNYIDVSSLPFQVPLGCLIPKRLENLLPACKNVGSTHITNGCLRLHPVEWAIGEAVGHLVAHCLAAKESPRGVRAKRVAELQAELAKAGVDLSWPEQIATTAR